MTLYQRTSYAFVWFIRCPSTFNFPLKLLLYFCKNVNPDNFDYQALKMINMPPSWQLGYVCCTNNDYYFTLSVNTDGHFHLYVKPRLNTKCFFVIDCKLIDVFQQCLRRRVERASPCIFRRSSNDTAGFCLLQIN